MKASRALRKAAELIDTPEKWTKGTSARDKAGSEVDSLDSRAVCFCSAGALHRAGIRALGLEDGYLEQAADGYGGYIAFNDAPDTTHGDIMTVFALAIALAEDAGD